MKTHLHQWQVIRMSVLLCLISLSRLSGNPPPCPSITMTPDVDHTETICPKNLSGTEIISGPVSGAAFITLCEGGNSGSFSAGIPSGGDGDYSYQWEQSEQCSDIWEDALAQNGVSNTLTFNPPALFISTCYRLRITDGSGSTGFSSIKTYEVVSDPVSPAITPVPISGSALCVGESASATFEPGEGGTGTISDVYEYSVNGGDNWSMYVPGTPIVATQDMIGSGTIRIRTRRTATGLGCNNGAYNEVYWNIPIDTEAPFINCPSDLSAPYNSQTCTELEIPDPSFGDNCGVTELTWEMTGATMANSPPTGINLVGTQQFNFGETSLTYFISDEAGNTSSCSFTVSVNAGETSTSLEVTPSDQQYSDVVTLAATINDGASGSDCSDSWIAAAGATFYIGTQEMGSVDLEVDGNDLVATLDDLCLLESTSGGMSPGIKPVSVQFSGIDSLHFNLPLPDPADLTILPESANLSYNGLQYFSTGSASSCDGMITLMAYVGDPNDTPNGCRGDIRNATVTFHKDTPNGEVLGATDLEVGLTDPDNYQEGIATTDFPYTLNNAACQDGGESFELYIHAGGYYDGVTDEPAIITLAVPGDDFVTGGGYLVLNNSAGIYTGTSGSRMNFGFNMKWNPSGKNLQGHINVIFRRWELHEGAWQWRNYKIKSNKINSMATDHSDPDYRKAIISTKANLTDVSDPLNPISLGGNLNLSMEAWESTMTTTGSPDKVAVTLTGNGNQGLLFSSNWDGTETTPQIIDGGSIRVRSDPQDETMSRPLSSPPLFAEARVQQPGDPGMDIPVRSNVIVGNEPNPFTESTTINLEIHSSTQVALEIYNSVGNCIAVLYRGYLEKGTHHFLFDAAGLPDGIYFAIFTDALHTATTCMVMLK